MLEIIVFGSISVKKKKKNRVILYVVYMSEFHSGGLHINLLCGRETTTYSIIPLQTLSNAIYKPSGWDLNVILIRKKKKKKKKKGKKKRRRRRKSDL
jgi:hypothetical protein